MIKKMASADDDLMAKVNELIDVVNELREYFVGKTAGELYPDVLKPADCFMPSVLRDLMGRGVVEVVDGVDVRLTKAARRHFRRFAP